MCCPLWRAGKCGYHVAPLQEVLAAGRLKYLDLLGGALAAAVGEAIHQDAQVRPIKLLASICPCLLPLAQPSTMQLCVRLL